MFTIEAKRSLLWLSLLALGCVSGPDDEGSPGSSFTAESESAAVTATIRPRAGEVVRGENELGVTFDVGGVELVAARGFMPAHAHGVDATVTEVAEEERFVVALDLYMTGRWEITLDLDIDGSADAVTFPLDVP